MRQRRCWWTERKNQGEKKLINVKDEGVVMGEVRRGSEK